MAGLGAGLREVMRELGLLKARVMRRDLEREVFDDFGCIQRGVLGPLIQITLHSLIFASTVQANHGANTFWAASQHTKTVLANFEELHSYCSYQHLRKCTSHLFQPPPYIPYSGFILLKAYLAIFQVSSTFSNTNSS